MVIPPGLEAILRIDPEIMHGKLCFAGTRVPLTIFLDNLADGMGIDEFLVNYPGVSREQAQAVLEWDTRETPEQTSIQTNLQKRSIQI